MSIEQVENICDFESQDAYKNEQHVKYCKIICYHKKIG